ncbi:hepatocyte nuclear factor 6-like [Octopus sinensis]|uniref:One cut domain family member n=1 Tax=Octopus sinensis TaxID=2607531 RepID=A0A6P7TRA8_9MOLL|nr:hepatocyte nuclear factor 6-like [Octopus sinensis]
MLRDAPSDFRVTDTPDESHSSAASLPPSLETTQHNSNLDIPTVLNNFSSYMPIGYFGDRPTIPNIHGMYHSSSLNHVQQTQNYAPVFMENYQHSFPSYYCELKPDLRNSYSEQYRNDLYSHDQSYSGKDSVDSDGPCGGSEEINTRELSMQIIAELKRFSIPQAIFSSRVLRRSQGTLSDLLRNPKPWSKLKSGRETFRRMRRWIMEPENERVTQLRDAVLHRKDLDHHHHSKRSNTNKKPRLVFTDYQRQTLNDVFKDCRRPSKEMQTTLATNLGLEVTTVGNFFMNARRRSVDKWNDDPLKEDHPFLASSINTDFPQLFHKEHTLSHVDNLNDQ